MGIVIRKGMPMPSQRLQLPKYPFDEMDIGDSFVVETDKTGTALRNFRNNIASAYARFRPKQFATRLIRTNGTVAVGIWRIG